MLECWDWLSGINITAWMLWVVPLNTVEWNPSTQNVSLIGYRGSSKLISEPSNKTVMSNVLYLPRYLSHVCRTHVLKKGSRNKITVCPAFSYVSAKHELSRSPNVRIRTGLNAPSCGWETELRGIVFFWIQSNCWKFTTRRNKLP